ncbi:hypothetical protein ILYODFUR_007771 [Ilyodon furcidens]|uniref:Secreted protein n=1 Tax=Ilyodon furcidens TaxID=33524 RepID=A0ABV0SY63_9TELE
MLFLTTIIVFSSPFVKITSKQGKSSFHSFVSDFSFTAAQKHICASKHHLCGVASAVASGYHCSERPPECQTGSYPKYYRNHPIVLFMFGFKTPKMAPAKGTRILLYPALGLIIMKCY